MDSPNMVFILGESLSTRPFLSVDAFIEFNDIYVTFDAIVSVLDLYQTRF